MVLQVNSQTSLIPRVITTINTKGDTLISFYLKDAKTILKDVLDKPIIDSLLKEYQNRDSIQTKTITLYLKDIKLLTLKSENQEKQIADLYDIIINKDKEIAIDETIIKKQKKEIRKQKILKVVFMITTVVLPVLTLLAIIR